MKLFKRLLCGLLALSLCLSVTPTVFAVEDRAMGTAGIESLPDTDAVMPMARTDPPTAFGIDVSTFQGIIDWDTVATQIDFAIIRCGYGSDLPNQDDRYWYRNVQECTRLGIPFGVYIYSYANTLEKARSEAQHVLRLLDGYDPTLPIYYDLEDNYILSNCTPAQILDITRTFCETIEAAGYRAGVYSNRNWWTNYLTSPEYDRWERWFAQYAAAANYDKDYSIWQYSCKGRLDGIDYDVDLNYWYGEFPPDYKSVPSAATLSIDKDELLTGEEFTFTLSADTRCDFDLTIVNADSGEVVVSQQVGSTYTGSLPTPGHYIARMSAYNWRGEGVTSNSVDLYVGGYTVRYDANGGSGAPAPQTKYHGKDLPLSATEPARENHLFLGWAVSPDASAADYLPGAVLSRNENLTLYAVWGHPCYYGHRYDSVTREPTCTDEGYTAHTCAVCGDSYTDGHTAALGHDLGSWTVETAATCTQDGAQRRDCSRCAYSETQVTDATGHSYENGICTSCADVEVLATGPSGDTRWTLTADGVLTVSGGGSMKNYGWEGNQPWAAYADRIKSVVIQQGVTAIGSGAFKGMTALESVTLPDSGLSRIGIAAFYGCTSLKEIYIPDGIYTVWEYTFKNCSSLASVRLPRTLIKLDQGAFEACIALTDLFLPTNVQIIGGWAFKGCTALKTVDMQWADATEIRPGAFKNCTALKKIILPADIRVLGDSCFYGIGAASFVVPETVTEIQAWCFARSSVREITFRGDAPAIGTGAFNKIALTAHYPAANATWTADTMQHYGGTVTWNAQ